MADEHGIAFDDGDVGVGLPHLQITRCRCAAHPGAYDENAVFGQALDIGKGACGRNRGQSSGNNGSGQKSTTAVVRKRAEAGIVNAIERHGVSPLLGCEVAA